MVEIIFSPQFKKSFNKIKNPVLKEKIIKQISKIKLNPEIGKPMSHGRNGTRELYIAPFRLSYIIENNVVFILDLYHKDRQ